MKQRTGSSVSSYSTKENEVAEILVKLRSLILELECGHGILPQSWGRKKKRSAISVNPKAEEASSPATPLSFSPSESDENPTSLFRRNVSLKRKREHCLKIIQDLSKDNDLLSGEIKNVNCYFDKLKDYNLKLKAKKQELTHGPRQGVVVHKQPQQQPQFPGVAHHPPLISNQSACGVATTSSGVPSSSSNDVGPIGIPDLNLPLEESMTMEFCEPLDMSVNVANRNLSRAMAAQARQNRLHIYRFKNSIGISKPRYSCR
ncbi:hypothetical protein LR48_Vigan09g032100 [Vigna angularis]|uniref:Uncharacterized protein n=2 Tax=Phaseolus angularis TaxID=3914 RepID=A0A0L9V9U2_PHAAN|nr:uncharacterized protein LOC108342162 isoform X1 [Vigna angularis]KAG2400703.1 uncharacterized protein HKW66_Vig0094430 [Vigna angularis]KOM51662.1 hypothetical protein LR48_Vigan09g032100 [Vigna angularis]BAT77685.1 hypothetical protein VIGAN_02027500 [Vigna angularis var. angularis]